MLLEILAILPVLYILKLLLERESEPVCGVYIQPGKWFFLKRIIFTIFVWYKKWQSKTPSGDKKKVGGVICSERAVEEIDKVQPLQDHPNAIDAAYFEASDKAGNSLVVRVGRRNERQAELWLLLHVQGIGTFQHPIHPDTLVYNTDGQTFTAGGLNIEVVEGGRTWKIMYNGCLRQGVCNDLTQGEQDCEMVYVKFNFIWNALSDIFNCNTDLALSTLCDAVAREKWSGGFWENLEKFRQPHYEQAGEMHGCLQIEGAEENVLYMRGVRSHVYGIYDWSAIHRYVKHYVTLEDGTFVQISLVSYPNILSHYGYLVHPNAVTVPVTWTDLNLPILGEYRNPPDEYVVRFQAGGKTYNCEVTASCTSTFYQGENWDNVVYEKLASFTVNGEKGSGVTEFCYRYNGECPIPHEKSVPLLSEPKNISHDAKQALVLPFTVKACQSSDLVGGKGCQLALLTSMDETFIVPRGFCLTISSFKQQLHSSPELEQMLDKLNNIACGMIPGKLQDVCQEATSMFLSTPVCSSVQQAVASELIKLFGHNFADIAFAVRSSAAGEDGCEMSAAGQMDTILGVKGVNKIFEAIQQCWSSQYTYQACEYRRQNGQPVNSLMGIVVQEMVHSETSGVLFTHDPLTGNPAKMVLNANYGLGESVVSGSSEPDTITLSRSYDDQLTITNTGIGSKAVLMHVSGDGGTETLSVDEKAAQTCCLSDDVIYEIASIGIRLEKSFGSPRDVEWAVCNKQVYLLQARPITSFGLDSEYDLLHEFDTPLASDEEWVTTCNIGEMMPGAMTPLGCSTFIKAVNFGIEDISVACGVKKIPQTKLSKFVGLSCGHGLINLHNLGFMCENHILLNDKRVSDVVLMGRVLDELTVDKLIKYNGTSPLHKRFLNAVQSFRARSGGIAEAKKLEERLKTYKLDCTGKMALEVYKMIDDNLDDYYEAWRITCLCSSAGGTWIVALMMILSRGEADWSTEHYSDIAMLLAHCSNVYSADVPTAIQNLAESVGKADKTEEFMKMNEEEAVSYLRRDSAEVGQQFSDFLKHHGHRYIREAEFYERSWRSHPERLVNVLKAILKTNRHMGQQKRILSNKEMIGRLKSSPTWIGRFMLKFILPKAQAAVGQREWGKSLCVQLADVFKQAYWALAELMMKEGRLPHKDLLFFLTHQEIGQLLETRSARLVAKSARRKRLLPKQMDLVFPEISVGHPEPVVESVPIEVDASNSLLLKGFPVSQGVVKGTARVVKCLEDAGQIEADDILIVNYTDVGWTPYFPLISGLVTEIGGLLSHGAVVAREYGLPCVVNAHHATALFKSGDQVILNGSEGTLQKQSS